MALPTRGRVPRRLGGPAGATAGDLQVCLRAVTFGRLLAVEPAGRMVHGLRVGELLHPGADMTGAGRPRLAIRLGAAARRWSFSERIC